MFDMVPTQRIVLAPPSNNFGCRHGWPIGLALPCQGCQVEADELERAFRAGVADGRWDADGYTPAERRQQQRKQRQGAA